MLDGVMLLWFLLTAVSFVFVAVDIRSTPEHPILKWGFVLITAYMGVVGAFLYVLGCREPLPGLHKRYVAVRWRQVLGSTMHCVAGDGIGILAGAVVATLVQMPRVAEIAMEYLLGFAFGWTIFQSLFMRGMAGGSYRRALSSTFLPELLSMNLLMAGMVPVMSLIMRSTVGGHNPATAAFWFSMSMALLIGFATAYPMNWWLVSNHLKHGMMTVRPSDGRTARMDAASGLELGFPVESVQPQQARETRSEHNIRRGAVALMTILSFLAFGLGLVLTSVFGG